MSVVDTTQWGWLRSSSQAKVGRGLPVKMFVVGRGESVPTKYCVGASAEIKKQIKSGSSVTQWQSGNSETWLLQLHTIDPKDHYGMFTPSPFAMARDLVGTCFRQILNKEVKSFTLEHKGESVEEFRGLCVGLEMARYHFKNRWPEVKKKSFKVSLRSSLKDYKKIKEEAAYLGEGVNLARYLVDLPGNVLQPKDYAESLQTLFAKKAKTKVTLWNGARLKKEGMGLHLAVGQGASQDPHMVHIEYRCGGKEKPVAFVGKGITFDSGGLDIKPATGMRLMKKDMGGSASVAGLAWWVVHSKLNLNCDFYFAIAENAVSAESFRPGDILTARNGKTVEIHNTDAEGRLVLADVMTVAAEKKPQMLIDIATLTGAIKFGLGGSTPGLFCNSDNMAETLLKSSQAMGDLSWRMPLVPEERARLKSDVADLVNCTNGFGGAVTAALFLEAFTEGVPWAHFDIYGWVEKSGGPYASAGGSGQMVQALSHFLESQASS